MISMISSAHEQWRKRLNNAYSRNSTVRTAQALVTREPTQLNRGREHEPIPRCLGAWSASTIFHTQTNPDIPSNKIFKVEPFPKGIKPKDQYHERTFWLADFEIAAEKAGIFGQRTKATDLSLHIGEEMRRIFVAKEMQPREIAVNRLETYFQSLSDESVDVTSFNSQRNQCCNDQKPLHWRPTRSSN